MKTLVSWIESHIDHFSVLFNQTSLKKSFSTKTNNCWNLAFEYIKGLVTSPGKSNLTSISDNCSYKNNQAFSHFLSQSPWDNRALLNWIRDSAWQLIGKNGALVIDECGNPKAGTKSVGVQRQYCGNIGKVENSQVGVYLAYVKNGIRLLIDCRLYLTKSWCSDPERCKCSGIPQSEQAFRTKGELALEMIVDAIRAGHRFTHVCMDGFYGSQPWLLTKLEQMKVTYVGDIQSGCHVYVTKPEYSIPPKKGNRGRDPSRKVVLNTRAIRVNEIIKNITHWKTIKIRESTDGFLIVKFTVVKVWRIDSEISQPLPVWLLIRKELDDSEVKYSICNAIGIQSWDRLAKMQSDRYWIERSFQDAIALAGMADYQVRNWNAWHHHMSLVLLAMLWITKEQHTMLEDFKEITIQDVVKVIKLILPLKVQTALTIARTIMRNHRNRRDSRKSKMNRKMQLNRCGS